MDLDLIKPLQNGSCSCGSSEFEVINEIKSASERLTLWFRNNCVKVNPDKFHFLLSDKKVITWIFGNGRLSIKCSEKFFRITVVNNLTLEGNVQGLYKKASQKVSAAAIISSLNKENILLIYL